MVGPSGAGLVGCEPFDEPDDLGLIAAQCGGHGCGVLFGRQADAHAIEINHHDRDGGSVVTVIVIIAGASFNGFDVIADRHEGSVPQRVVNSGVFRICPA
jgi:hypothetical protein